MRAHFGRLWQSIPFAGSTYSYFSLTEVYVAPPLFFLSPAQLWIGPLISKVNKFSALEEDWLPQFKKTAAELRTVFSALGSHDGDGVVPFLLQFETGGMLLLSATLELLSAASALGAPLVLHLFLQKSDSVSLAWILVLASLLATIFGRAKDEVCRVHSAWVECMLRSVVFDKSFHLSPSARMHHPPAKIININAVDVNFLTNYVLKIHDIWSAPLQIIGIGVLTYGVMGWTSIFGFLLVAGIFASQTRLGKRIGQSVGGYVRHNDARLGAYRDMLNNIKGVKASGMEDVFQHKVTEARGKQLEFLRFYLKTSFAMFTAVNQTTPYLAACVAFLAYALSGAKLTSEVVFPCLAYFQMLYQPVTLASLALSRQFSVRPSVGRVRDLLDASEYRMPLLDSENPDSACAITFESAVFEWPSEPKDNTFSLRVGDLNIPRDRMTAVIGPNGSGKSSLLQAILGDMILKSGSCRVHSTVAYCSQDPWVMSGTLRDNIVFNSRRGYEARRYADVVRACGLDRDFAQIPGGTENATVGESGGNLSGGQRARVSLARAIYSDADILLLDDPLSALDAHVRAQLFDTLRALTKTVILVTLHTSFVSRVDNVVVVDDSKIRWKGPLHEFMLQKWSSIYISSEHGEDEVSEKAASDQMIVQEDDATTNQTLDDEGKDTIQSIWQQEERARGAVQLDVAKFYIRVSGGVSYATLVLIMMCLLTTVKVLSQYWFVWWIADSLGLSQGQYMGSFLGLTLFQGAVTATVGLTLVAASLKAAKLVHEVILVNLIGAPLWFFQRNPTGRILNRLSKDTEAMDSKVMNAVDGLLGAGTSMFASVTIVASSGLYLLAAVLPFLLTVGWCLQRFRVTAREVQRLDAVLQSPALSIVTESLKATSSARAYGAATFLVARHGHALDRLAAAKICRQSLDTWITFRAELAAATVLLVLAQLTVHGIIPQVSASLALATATTLARNVYLLAWACTDLEIQLNAVERLQTYHDRIPSERDDSGLRLNMSRNEAPLSSEIGINEAYLKYDTRKTPALDGITLRIGKGEKVGLIGRTGSGKSTLISVISRLVDIQIGTISIGGVDTSAISPRVLRRTVVTLPQETLIFQGTVRENVDPHQKRSDKEIWEALDACQMNEVLRNKYGKDMLSQELSSDGADLSAGQKQLVCAARVLLERPKVLLVDEASANVDFDSDEALQSAWQALPSDTTVITIAHRASSLAWMDRVIVMDNGKIVEDGSPWELLEQSSKFNRTRTSYYRASILQDGPKALEKALKIARK